MRDAADDASRPEWLAALARWDRDGRDPGASSAARRHRRADGAGATVMNTRLLAVVAVLLIVVGVLATSSLFIVDQTEQALV